MGQPEEHAWVPLRFGDDAVADPRVEGAGNDRREERMGFGIGEALEDQFGEPLELLDRLAHREHKRGALGSEPACDEREHLSRWPIEPVSVVDGAYQRLLGTDLGEQAEHGQSHQEPVYRSALAHAEGSGERILLWARQSADTIQHRRAQAVQPGERQVLLRLHAAHLGNPESRCRPGVLQQRRLAEPWFPTHHQRLTLPGPGGPEEEFERLTVPCQRAWAIRSRGEVRPELPAGRVNADVRHPAMRFVEHEAAVAWSGLELAAITRLHHWSSKVASATSRRTIAPTEPCVFEDNRHTGPQPAQLAIHRLASMREPLARCDAGA